VNLPPNSRNRNSPALGRKILTGLGVAAILAGCSTQTNRKWLTIFFDGVPGTGTATNASLVVLDENGKPLDRTPAIQAAVAAPVKPKFTAHPPYEEKKCSECHESRFSVKMKGPQKQVCFSCHDDFLGKVKFKHQPVDNGECSSCHDPHGSANPKMLVQAGQTLCFQCHDEFPKTAKVKHQPVENGECLSCHSAHASDEKKLLIKPGAKLCFECHDDFQKLLENAAFKHDPVANGDCNSCHGPHQSEFPKLLLKDPRKLCFECHEEKDMVKVKAHAQVEQKGCSDCHDPHLGKDKFFLKADAAKAEAPKIGASPK
jgi:predicted CXXCH cytochrome family protein